MRDFIFVRYSVGVAIRFTGVGNGVGIHIRRTAGNVDGIQNIIAVAVLAFVGNAVEIKVQAGEGGDVVRIVDCVAVAIEPQTSPLRAGGHHILNPPVKPHVGVEQSPGHGVTVTHDIAALGSPRRTALVDRRRIAVVGVSGAAVVTHFVRDDHHVPIAQVRRADRLRKTAQQNRTDAEGEIPARVGQVSDAAIRGVAATAEHVYIIQAGQVLVGYPVIAEAGDVGGDKGFAAIRPSADKGQDQSHVQIADINVAHRCDDLRDVRLCRELIAVKQIDKELVGIDRNVRQHGSAVNRWRPQQRFARDDRCGCIVQPAKLRKFRHAEQARITVDRHWSISSFRSAGHKIPGAVVALHIAVDGAMDAEGEKNVRIRFTLDTAARDEYVGTRKLNFPRRAGA